MDEASRARIRVFLNDPAARGQRPVTSDAPADTETSPWGFRVEGDRPPAGRYEPDTPEFLYWQISSALARGRAVWSRLVPRDGSWIAGPVLPAVPVEGEGLNAYYDRRALHFFRDVNAATGEAVHSGDSADVVTHEQGHAVLDAIRADLWDAPHFEVAAFHESFGDVAAILVALDEPALARAVIEETSGSLDDSNLVSRLAEELAAAVLARYGPGSALPGALRDAVNDFRYVSMRSLPDDASADSLSREPHSFGRILTGACWDSLVRLYLSHGAARSESADERLAALSKAARELGRRVADASTRSPSRAAFFRRFAAELVSAGPANERSGAALRRVFERRGLPLEARPPAARPEVQAGIGGAGEPLTTRLLDAIRARLGARREEEILVRPSARDGSLAGRRVRDLLLSGPEFGPADGAAVEISDSFTVAVTESGYVTASHVDLAGTDDEEDAREFVRTLARRGRIAGEEGAPPDPGRLYREGRSHFVVRERDGVRRLRRAWVSRARR